MLSQLHTIAVSLQGTPKVTWRNCGSRSMQRNYLMFSLQYFCLENYHIQWRIFDEVVFQGVWTLWSITKYNWSTAEQFLVINKIICNCGGFKLHHLQMAREFVLLGYWRKCNMLAKVLENFTYVNITSEEEGLFLKYSLKFTSNGPYLPANTIDCLLLIQVYTEVHKLPLIGKK